MNLDKKYLASNGDIVLLKHFERVKKGVNHVGYSFNYHNEDFEGMEAEGPMCAKAAQFLCIAKIEYYAHGYKAKRPRKLPKNAMGYIVTTGVYNVYPADFDIDKYLKEIQKNLKKNKEKTNATFH